MTSVAEQAEPGVVPQTSSLPLTYRRSGLAWALLSGACWGLDGVILGVALAAAPLAGAAALPAPLAAAALTTSSPRAG